MELVKNPVFITGLIVTLTVGALYFYKSSTSDTENKGSNSASTSSSNSNSTSISNSTLTFNTNDILLISYSLFGDSAVYVDNSATPNGYCQIIFEGDACAVKIVFHIVLKINELKENKSKEINSKEYKSKENVKDTLRNKSNRIRIEILVDATKVTAFLNVDQHFDMGKWFKLHGIDDCNLIVGLTFANQKDKEKVEKKFRDKKTRESKSKKNVSYNINGLICIQVFSKEKRWHDGWNYIRKWSEVTEQLNNNSDLMYCRFTENVNEGHSGRLVYDDGKLIGTFIGKLSDDTNKGYVIKNDDKIYNLGSITIPH